MKDTFLKLVDKAVMGYLAYRAGQLTISNLQAKKLQEFAKLVLKLHNDVDLNKDNLKDKIDERYN